MIDWDRVHTLREEVGAEDFDEVVDLFLDEVDEVIVRLRNAPATSTLEEDLHFLKGSALGLGFRAFSDLCQKGETLSAQGKQDEVSLDPILASYDTSKEQFLHNLPKALAG